LEFGTLVRDTWEIIESGATMIRPSLIKILTAD